MKTTNKKAFIIFVAAMAVLFAGASVFLTIHFRQYIFSSNTLAIIVFAAIAIVVVGLFVSLFYLFNRQR